MSKHSKHKKEHHKDHKEPAKAEPKAEQTETEKGESMIAMLDNEDTQADAKEGEEGIYRNSAELNGKKSGGHEPVAFIPPNPPTDYSAQASMDAHKAAEEDKDPADVQQELTHKEILDGALDPSSPSAINKDLPDAGKNPDAAVGSEAPADEKKDDALADAGQEITGPGKDSTEQPSTDGSEQVSDLETAVGTDAGATPSAS